jgi:hypothetical protein
MLISTGVLPSAWSSATGQGNSCRFNTLGLVSLLSFLWG